VECPNRAPRDPFLPQWNWRLRTTLSSGGRVQSKSFFLLTIVGSPGLRISVLVNLLDSWYAKENRGCFCAALRQHERQVGPGKTLSVQSILKWPYGFESRLPSKNPDSTSGRGDGVSPPKCIRSKGIEGDQINQGRFRLCSTGTRLSAPRGAHGLGRFNHGETISSWRIPLSGRERLWQGRDPVVPDRFRRAKYLWSKNANGRS